MGLLEGSFRIYLHIPPIIQRSKSVYHGSNSYLLFFLRVLLATIRDKGGCPCPRCLVKMQNAAKAGVPTDMMTRATRVRVDSNALQGVIQQARDLIFRQGRPIKSAAVERLLKPHSLVPTVVSKNLILLV
jgi:Zn-finger nucleic acid-binding protein